jgi:hypothetical protein
MLGEKIGETTGKTVGMRVLPHDDHGPRMEITIQQEGKILGVDVVDHGTYESTLQPGNYFSGTGRGIFMTKDGEGGTWTATGTGHPTGKGSAAKWRGSVFYQTPSQKLARLNGMCVLFEYDVDENGNSKGAVHEWR